jgi:hypothetical protein
MTVRIGSDATLTATGGSGAASPGTRVHEGDPTDGTPAGLFRGLILRKSDVGAAALTLDVLLFRLVCGNHVRHVIGA